jgi:hypothetical protein
MKTTLMNIFAKRLRSKASLAASLSPGRLVTFRRTGSDFLRFLW